MSNSSMGTPSALSISASTSSTSSSSAAAASLGGSNNNSPPEKDKDSMWYFSSEQLANSPSRRHGIDADQELSYRQMTAYLIQEMGQRLQVSQLCINTAIVYMHRFYAFHSFTHFHRNGIAAASLFLAAKVEEQPRKLEHVIKASNKCLNLPTPAINDQYYMEQAQDLVFNENVLLQTLGFDVAIDHPHTVVVKTCHLVKACKDLAQTSYFLASNSLHLTSMCLQYRPTVVACFCIYLACKWSRWEIPQSTEGKHWFHYVDKSVNMELLKQLTEEFIAIYEKSPARLKSKLNSIKALAQGASNRSNNGSSQGGNSNGSGSSGGSGGKKGAEDWKLTDMMKVYHSNINTNDTNGQPQGNGNSIYSDQSNQLLPPPPPLQNSQMRKSEMHSSQHRSHHSSSTSSSSSSLSSSSHHHGKQHGYGAADVTDHKSSHKPYGSNSVNRPPRDHSQSSHSGLMQSNSSRSNMSVSSSGALMSSQSSSQMRAQQQPSNAMASSSGHPMDLNYHKSRGDRSMVPSQGMPSASSHGASHKMPSMSKDSSRSSMSSSSSRNSMMEQQQQLHGKSAMAGKMYPPPPNVSGLNMTNVPPPPYGSSQQANQAYASQSADRSSNSMLHQRSAYGNSISAQVPGYHQNSSSTSATGGSGGSSMQLQMSQPRQSSSAANKHDGQKSLSSSVHIQQQQHAQMQHHHKQPAAIESSYAQAAAMGAAMDQQQMSAYAGSEQQQHQNMQYNVPPMSSKSLFEPDWSDKQQQLQSGGYNNGNNGSIMGSQQSSDAFTGYKIPKGSPSKRDTPTKKDKNRNGGNSSSMDATASMHMQTSARSAASMMSNQQQQHAGKRKPEYATNLNELAGASMMPGGAIKRPNESLSSFKQEDDLLLRDSKIRKLEACNAMSGLSNSNSNAGSSLYGSVDIKPDLSKLQVVNGIETNPDLVRSLLKESLCTNNALIKSEPITNPSLQPPAELLAPAPIAANMIKSEPEATLTNAPCEALSNSVTGDEGHVSKSKKAKKEKHKHKEKDKSKDREERKKHKKDKDRHKDRERDADNLNESSMTGSGGAGGEQQHIALKIKIPKERITGELNSSTCVSAAAGGNSHHHHSNSAAATMHSSAEALPPPKAPALKIKIPKDIISSAGYSLPSSGHNSSSGSSSSSKKKDRDRDRERDKDKKRHDHAGAVNSSSSSSKSNGNGLNAMLPTVAAGNTSTLSSASNTSSSSSAAVVAAAKGHNSSKMSHHNNMSQLFGESNDEDDDDDDDDADSTAATLYESSMQHAAYAASSANTSGYRYGNSNNNMADYAARKSYQSQNSLGYQR